MRIEVYTDEHCAARGRPRLIGWMVLLPGRDILLEAGPPDGPGGDSLQWLRAAVYRSWQSGGWPQLGEAFDDLGIVLHAISGMLSGRVVPDAGDYHVVAREVMPGPGDDLADRPVYVFTDRQRG
jgi:hypothetical protein